MLSFSHFKSVSLLVLSMLLLTACASKSDKLESKQAALYFGAGTQSLMEQQYTEALKNLLEANRLDPENSDILNNLGMAYFFKGERDLAIKSISQALKINPANSDAKVNLASIYFKDGRLNEAEKIYKNVLKDLTFDKQARTYYNLGVIELARNNSVAAEKYFKKSIAEDENYCPSFYQVGLMNYKRRQFNTALRNFKEAAMGTCYDSPASHYYQALTMIELRKYDDARIKLDEIDTRFKKSVFAVKARQKVLDLNEIEKNKSNVSHASGKVLESPDF